MAKKKKHQESTHIVAVPQNELEEKMITCYRWVNKAKSDFHECPICKVTPDNAGTYQHDGPLERRRKGTLN